jgi:hypothetical protein
VAGHGAKILIVRGKTVRRTNGIFHFDETSSQLMRGVPRLVCVYPIEFWLKTFRIELGNPILKFTNQPKTLISHQESSAGITREVPPQRGPQTRTSLISLSGSTVVHSFHTACAPPLFYPPPLPIALAFLATSYVHSALEPNDFRIRHWSGGYIKS